MVVSPVLIVLMLLDYRLLFTWLLLFSYSTDIIDGYLARHFKLISQRGARLDSLGDQINFGVALTGMAYFEFGFVEEQFLLISIVLILYLAQMIVALWKYGKATSFHTYSAKFSALLQGIFIVWLLFFGPVLYLFYAVIFMGILETIEEIILITMYDKWVANVKGIYWAISDPRRLPEQSGGNE